MKRPLIGFVAIVVLAILAVPVINLIVGLPSIELPALAADSDSQAAIAILSHKCANCHSGQHKLPYYASLPFAKGIIEHDIQTGQRYMDFAAALSVEPGKPISDTVLAKTAFVIRHDVMPPNRYLALHWNGGLTGAEKQALLHWIERLHKQHYVTNPAPQFTNEFVQPVIPIPGINAQKAALGAKLYHDKRLSKDNSISCASCHDLAKGGTDQQQFSDGVGGVKGGANAPTTFNSGYQFVDFWDGRAPDLAAQADGPVNNPSEMASNWTDIAAKLQRDADFTRAFLAVYPEGYSKETCTDAIAEYEKTLTTPNSRFDKYLRGDMTAITDEEKQGYALFKDLGCVTCHVGQILGGQSFERMGRKGDYFKYRGGPITKTDLGRFNVTHHEADRYVFKVPTLRNVALTFPYFHDGSVKDLADAVRIMARFQLGKTLMPDQINRIVAFLDTLTGEYEGKPLQPPPSA